MSENKDFKDLDVYSDWCYKDAIYPGKKEDILKDGDEVEILFPNNEVHRYPILVESRNYPINDMGHVFDSVDNRAYILITYKGAVFSAYLRDANLKIRRCVKANSEEEL